MRQRLLVTVMAVLLAVLLLVPAPGTGPSAWADPGTPPKCPPGQNCK
jgi:hypothetical protein